MTIKVALAGAGAFGIKHLDGIQNIPPWKSSPSSAATWPRPRKWPTSTASPVTTKLEDSLAIRKWTP